MLITKKYLYHFSIINIHENTISDILKRIFLLYRKIYSITMEIHFARKIVIKIFLYFHVVECLRSDLSKQMVTFQKMLFSVILFSIHLNWIKIAFRHFMYINNIFNIN